MQIKLWLYSLVFWVSGVSAEVFVVADYGSTIELHNYMQADKRSQVSQRQSFTADDVEVLVGKQFPLNSKIANRPDLEEFKPYQLGVKLPANFALVGTGLNSQNWLKENYQKIKSSGALVVVIEAPSLDVYNSFQGVLSRAGLKVVYSESDPFIDLIHEYPVLVVDGVAYP